MEFEYDVALSFAGENRQFVSECAEIFHALGIKVFYDSYETDTLLGKDLYSFLSNIYQKHARFAVVFISEAYKKKLWTKHELKYICARVFAQEDEYLLPVKLDETELEEVPPTIGYILGDSPLKVAITIARKINPALDVELMISQLEYFLPDYTIKIIGSNVDFCCSTESFHASYPLSFMMELYRQDLIETAFILPAIVPN